MLRQNRVFGGPSRLRHHLVVGAMLVVGRAAQCAAAAFAQAIVAKTSSHATQDRPFAAVILVYVKPHVTQTPLPVAHINAQSVLPEILPLHPEESFVLHFTAPALQLRLLVLLPQRRRVRPIARPLELSPRVAQPQQAYSLNLNLPSTQIARCMRDPAPIPASPCSRPHPCRRCSRKSGLTHAASWSTNASSARLFCTPFSIVL